MISTCKTISGTTPYGTTIIDIVGTVVVEIEEESTSCTDFPAIDIVGIKIVGVIKVRTMVMTSVDKWFFVISLVGELTLFMFCLSAAKIHINLISYKFLGIFL